MTAVSGAASATFVYDGDGNRVKGVVGGVTTTYSGNYFEWTDSTSTMKTYYYAGRTRVAEWEGSTLYWLFGDHLGSTSLITNATGAVVAETRYLPYGQAYWQWGALQRPAGAGPTLVTYPPGKPPFVCRPANAWTVLG